MKKIESFLFRKPPCLLHFFILILGVYGCNQNTPNAVTSNVKDTVIAHNPSVTRAKPYMWVDKTRSQVREANFGRKLILLSQHMGKDETESIFFPVGAFRSMIAYFDSLNYSFLNVYIVAYSSKGSESVPDGYENKLSVIFAPANSLKVDLGYFTIPENSQIFDPGSPRFKLTADIKDKWVKNYIKSTLLYSAKMKFLVKTINKDDVENYTDANNRKVLSDTRCITYLASNIKEMVEEIDIVAQPPNSIVVSGVKLFFAAYKSTGNDDSPPTTSYKFKNRLIVQFEFTKKNSNGEDEVFYLDDTDGFNERPPARERDSVAIFNPDKRIKWIRAWDKGQLCPPNCPPGDGNQ